MDSPPPPEHVTAATTAWLPHRYWGKADPAYRCEPKWHPLPYHALDVAAVGHAYLARHPRLLEYFARQLGLSGAQTHAWLSFWLALHDLGKFASSFQGLRNDLVRVLQQREINCSYQLRHDSLGALVWKDQLLVQCDVLGLGVGAGKRLKQLQPWVNAVTGHHGQPPRLDTGINLLFDAADIAAAAQFVAAARTLLLPQDVLDAALALGKGLERSGKRLSWWLAGLAVLADWIGSNTEYFTYRDEEIPLERYWREALDTAENALRASGATPQACGPAHELAPLFGWNKAAPRIATPLQAWAANVPLPDAPQLYLLEDVTGAGKTEAALMLAHRLMQGGHADGLYFGLPTMATANAMLPRVQAIAGKLFADDAHPSVVLAHGQRNLVPGFRGSVLPASRSEDDPAQQDDETASARCAAWLADSSKKALLAHIGVGTIDQAHLAVLHAKHQSLRLLGLFRKVLIVDEVHACDPYMRTLLARLLEFHAAAGGSAILLSATLPQHMKQALVDAFAQGLGAAHTPALEQDAYPLAVQMWATDAKPLEQPLATRPEVRRSVAVDYLADPMQVQARIHDAIARGRCVCWIRNTVADTIEAWQFFADALGSERVELFHARFAMGDRLATETRVIDRFGERSDAEKRTGRLVIATQVIEQSLDVDFDLLVSDLAPIDRLIQRAGRLQRHVRDASGNRIEGTDQRGGARLLVFGPAFTPTPSADWYRQVFAHGAYVYPHVGQLWLTARCLQSGGFAMPDDGRRLVESVFGDTPQAEVPEALSKASETVEGKDWAAVNHAASNALQLGSGYVRGGNGDWLNDTDQSDPSGFDDWTGASATRLGEPTTWVRLARWHNGVLSPWHDQGWEASSLRLPSRLIAEPVLDVQQQAARQQVESALPDRGRWSLLLPLTRADDRWFAIAKDQRGTTRHWCYDEKKGLSECA